MSDRDELRSLSVAMRDLVAWDVEDELPGYPPGKPLAKWSRPETTPEPTTARRAPPKTTPVEPTPAPVPAGPPPTTLERPALDALRAELGDCKRCKLCDLGRRSIVFGEGNPNADLLFAGEGPGFHEDRLGRPFVGKAGELLDKMIGAMGLAREDVYICNVVKCRPPKNRDPEPDEVLACQPFLRAQVRSIQPKVVVALGRFAAQSLLETTTGINRLRGEFHPYLNAKLMPTFHPAYLLRKPEDKRKAWADLQLVMAELGLKGR